MTRYSGQPRDRILVKGYGFLSFPKNMGKNIIRNISEIGVVNIAKNFSIMLNNLQLMRL